MHLSAEAQRWQQEQEQRPLSQVDYPPRRPRFPFLTLLILAILLYWSERVVWGEPDPNTGAGPASHSTQGGARTKDPPPPPPPPQPEIDAPRVHRVLQPPPCSFGAWSALCREPPTDPPARTLGSLRALVIWMGAAGVFALVGLIRILIRKED